MKRNLYYRVLVIATFVTGILFVTTVPELTDNVINWMIITATFFFLAYSMKKEFSKLSNDRINQILYLSFFKKIGSDFSKE